MLCYLVLFPFHSPVTSKLATFPVTSAWRGSAMTVKGKLGLCLQFLSMGIYIYIHIHKQQTIACSLCFVLWHRWKIWIPHWIQNVFVLQHTRRKCLAANLNKFESHIALSIFSTLGNRVCYAVLCYAMVLPMDRVGLRWRASPLKKHYLFSHSFPHNVTQAGVCARTELSLPRWSGLRGVRTNHPKQQMQTKAPSRGPT